MSDMYGAVKSNVFRVKDAAKFRIWFKENVKFGDEIELFDHDEEGVFSFGGYEQYPSAWPNFESQEGEDVEEWDAQEFAKELRKHLVPGQTFQVVAGGHEKLRYVGCSAFIVPPRGKPVFVSLYSDSDNLLKNLRKQVRP